MSSQTPAVPYLHPIFVHAPQALFPVALVSFLVFLVTGSRDFEVGAHVCSIFGLLATPFAIASGYLDWKLRYRGYMTRVFRIKFVGSYLLLVVALPLVLLRHYYPEQVLQPFSDAGLAYLAFLVACTVNCLVLGYYGGKLVFH